MDESPATVEAIKASLGRTLTARARRARLTAALSAPAADGDAALRQVVGEVLAAQQD